MQKWIVRVTLFEYAVEERGFTPPSKKVMDWLLDATFAQDRGPDGLEQALCALGERGILPPYKRRVMVGLWKWNLMIMWTRRV